MSAFQNALKNYKSGNASAAPVNPPEAVKVMETQTQPEIESPKAASAPASESPPSAAAAAAPEPAKTRTRRTRAEMDAARAAAAPAGEKTTAQPALSDGSVRQLIDALQCDLPEGVDLTLTIRGRRVEDLGD